MSKQLIFDLHTAALLIASGVQSLHLNLEYRASEDNETVETSGQ